MAERLRPVHESGQVSRENYTGQAANRWAAKSAQYIEIIGMKLDLHYVDTRLVELYDRDNPRGVDTDFYLSNRY
jgi:hypothetical protein